MNTTKYDYRKISKLETLKSDIDNLIAINKSEKNAITAALAKVLATLPDANAEFKLFNFVAPATSGSSLELAQRAGQSKLSELLSCEQFRNLEELSHLPDTAIYVCDSKKNLEVFVDEERMHIDDLLKENAVLDQHLTELSEYAKKAGGFINSSDEINIEQWLRFHDYPMPSTAKQLANLVDFFNRDLPVLVGTGHFYAQLKDPEISPTALSLIQREQIRNVIATFGASDTGQLLNRLVDQNTNLSVDFKLDPDLYINNLMESMIGTNLARDCLETLEWYDADSDEPPHQEDLQQIFMAAIVLNIDPNIGEIESKGRVQDYELYNPANAERHPSQILVDLQEYLVARNIIDAAAAPVAAYLLVADEAPEFLVKEIPDGITIGSPAWVVHSFTVAKIETIVPGSSRLMTYEQVQSYADLGAFDAQLEQLFGCAVITPILNWAATNLLIPYSTDGEYSAEDFCTAETFYTQYTEALEQCSNALNTPLPTREAMALSELKRAMPDGAYLTNKNYYHSDMPLSKPISIHELFMSGDLINEGWTGLSLSNRIGSSFEAYELDQVKPYLGRLQDIQELHRKAFDQYFKQLQQATATSLKLALSKMPAKDRVRLECGVLSFYTVRKKFSDHATKETQRLRDKYRGRYGVIICAEYQSKRYYYELFTLRAECYSRMDLRDIFLTTSIEYFEPTEAADKNEKQWQAQALDWPLDIDAYLKGTEPVKNANNRLVVEKLWESTEAERATGNLSQIQTFFSETTNKTVYHLLKYFPPAKYEELYELSYGVAPVEAAKKNLEQNIDLVLDLIIPFKGCIEDLTSGDPDREKAGIVGCVLDGMAVVGATLGVASKLASVALKPGSFLAKSMKLIRVTSSFAVSLVNPLDGVPSLLKKGAKLTQKGALIITGRGVKTSTKATRQIKSAFGTLDVVTAAKSLNCADLKWVRIEGIAELSQSVDVLICKRAVDWHQLSLSNYKARGGKITNFREIAFR